MGKAGISLAALAVIIGGSAIYFMTGKGDSPSPVIDTSAAEIAAAPAANAQASTDGKVIPSPAPFRKMTPQSLPPEAVARAPVYRSVDELIRVTLDEALGRPANYTDSINRSLGAWSYVCGQPLEANKSPFNYAKSRLKTKADLGQIDDVFCILAQKTDAGYRLAEFEIGMTDNPMASWAKTHSEARTLISRAPSE